MPKTTKRAARPPVTIANVPARGSIVILGCGAQKRAERSRAVELYTGPLYTSRLRLATALGGPSAILSAEHGLIAPDVEIDPYDRAIVDLSRDEFFELTVRVRRQFRELFPTWSFDDPPVVLLAAHRYVAALHGTCTGRNAKRVSACWISTPLGGLGMGDQRARCRELAELAEKRDALAACA